MTYKPAFIITIILLTFGLIFYLVKARASGSSYLHQPKGQYGVGYKEYYLSNDESCPNVFFNESNKDSYSASNKSYCNEIQLSVYYPTNIKGTSDYTPIYSLIADVKSFGKIISVSDIAKISEIKSYSGKNLPIVESQFPIIFFSPGYGLPSQEYENTVTELASHGYIVVGVNSQFINGVITFNNAMQSKPIEPQNEEDKKNLFRNSYSDMSYSYEILRQGKMTDSILNKINWNKVGLLGHSLGAAVVARFANHEGILAVVAQDLTIDLFEGNDCHLYLKTPFMHMFSSQMYQQNDKEAFPYLCKENKSLPYKDIVIIEKNSDRLYSMHMNFCDYSTLQYVPPIMSALDSLKIREPKQVFLGNGNGRHITNIINKKLLIFFDKYLTH